MRCSVPVPGTSRNCGVILSHIRCQYPLPDFFRDDYLRRLMKAEKWDCRYDPDTYYRLKRLDDMGFVLPTVINGDRRLVRIQELFGDENIPVEQRKWFNMKDYVEITDEGKNYVGLYDAVSKTPDQ